MKQEITAAILRAAEEDVYKRQMQFDPLPYSQMTSYMGNVSLGGTVESPSIVTPQVPMTPDGYDEEID